MLSHESAVSGLGHAWFRGNPFSGDDDIHDGLRDGFAILNDRQRKIVNRVLNGFEGKLTS
jgi:hypothetical protein